MPQQEYIKYLYEKEELSINQISQRVDINWRTAAKYAKNENWNEIVKPKQKRRRPVMEPFAETVDVWILEDQLLPRKGVNGRIKIPTFDGENSPPQW